MYTGYILRSLKTKRHYYGFTSDLEKRLKEHNPEKTRSIKAYIPWEIIYMEQFYRAKNGSNTRK